MSGEDWFSTDADKGVSPIYKNASVKAFVNADEYYADLRAEVEATGRDGFIYWIGFEAGGGVSPPMPAAPNNEAARSFPPRPPVGTDVTWFDLLKAASNDRGVAIRAMLNLHPSPKPPDKYKSANFTLVAELNKLTNCAAINDFRYLYLNGTHHQKLVLVYNAKGLMAYVGTCDVQEGRINAKWCEVHCKVMGDAALELYQVFAKRWAEHTAVFQRIGKMNSYIKPAADVRAVAAQSGNFLVQTATTYGNPNRANPFRFLPFRAAPSYQHVNYPHRIELNTEGFLSLGGIFLSPISLFKYGNDFFTEKESGATQAIEDALKQNSTYAFAQQGHTGIYHLIKKAIANTKETIYLEDQYLVNDDKMGSYASMLDLLVEKVKQTTFKKLIVFCTRIDDINNEFQFTGWVHRNHFIRDLIAAGNDKVVICQYKSRGTLKCSFGQPHESLFYIHSKTWVFDDEYLITGSANCNRRGYSHDSELDIGVYDQNKQFVHDLRVKMWKSRLNTQGMLRSEIQDNELNDFLSAAKFWEFPDRYGLTIENNRNANLAPSQYLDLDLAKFQDYLKAHPDGNPLDAVFPSLLEKLKMDGLWNFVVDPDGV